MRKELTKLGNVFDKPAHWLFGVAFQQYVLAYAQSPNNLSSFGNYKFLPEPENTNSRKVLGSKTNPKRTHRNSNPEEGRHGEPVSGGPCMNHLKKKSSESHGLGFARPPFGGHVYMDLSTMHVSRVPSSI